MTMKINNQGAIEAARVGFHAAFIEQFAISENNPVRKLLMEVSSNSSVEEWEWLRDVPDMEEWKADRFLAGLTAAKMRVVNRDFASGIRVPENAIDDDRLGLFAPQITELARKARTHRYREAIKMLINGFDGLAYPESGNGLGIDGAFFFSTSHATGSNKLTSALSADALDAAELLLGSMTAYDGATPLDEVTGTTLYIGPKLRSTAESLMKNAFLPSTAGTATQSNRLMGRYEIVVLPQLRGNFDDYWFLADDSKPIKPILFQLREDVTTSAVLGEKGGNNDSVPRFSRKEVWFGAEARYAVAPFEHRLIVGSVV